MLNATADIRQTTQAAQRIATQDRQAATSSAQEAQHVADQESQANQTIEGAIENNSKAIAAQTESIQILLKYYQSQATSIESLTSTLSSLATLVQIGTSKIEQQAQKSAKMEQQIGTLFLQYGSLLRKGASDFNSSSGSNDSDVDVRSNASEVAELKRDQVLGSSVILENVKAGQLLRPQSSSPEAQRSTMSELAERVAILEKTLDQQTKAFAQQTKLVAQQNEFFVQEKKKAKEEREAILDRARQEKAVLFAMIEELKKDRASQQEEMLKRQQQEILTGFAALLAAQKTN